MKLKKFVIDLTRSALKGTMKGVPYSMDTVWFILIFVHSLKIHKNRKNFF